MKSYVDFEISGNSGLSWQFPCWKPNDESGGVHWKPEPPHTFLTPQGIPAFGFCLKKDHRDTVLSRSSQWPPGIFCVNTLSTMGETTWPFQSVPPGPLHCCGACVDYTGHRKGLGQRGTKFRFILINVQFTSSPGIKPATLALYGNRTSHSSPFSQLEEASLKA